MKKTFTFRQPDNANTVQSEHTDTEPAQQNENESHDLEDITEREEEGDHRRV